MLSIELIVWWHPDYFILGICWSATQNSKISCHPSESDDDDDFCDVVHVQHRRTPAKCSIVVSTANAMVKTTVSSERNWLKNTKTIFEATATVAPVKYGRSTQVAPFLSDSTNWMDGMLVRQLMPDMPHEIAPGKTTGAWNNATYCPLSVWSSCISHFIFDTG
jgi:hypothetical protein